jgi:hypothetical protein
MKLIIHNLKPILMSSNEEGNFIAAFIFIGSIIAWAGSGYAAWQFTEPESFAGAILFIVAWGIFGYIAQILIGGLMMLLFGGN